MTGLNRPTLGVAVLLLAVCSAGTASRALEAVLPQPLETRFILRIDQLPDGIDIGGVRFNLDRQGRPHLAFGDVLISLGHRDDLAHEIHRLPGGTAIDRLAWMRDGTLLVISGQELGVPTEDGLAVILALPSADMRIEPASSEAFYLYGGDSPAQRRSLYIHRRGGRLLHLLKAPTPIHAVAGDSDVTFLSIDKSIYLLVRGEPLRFVYEAEEAVTALALAPPWGLFYGTEQTFGYVTESGMGFAFLRGKGGEPKVHEDDLYLFITDEGVVRSTPVSSFEQLARVLVEGIRGSGPTPEAIAAPLELDLAPAADD